MELLTGKAKELFNIFCKQNGYDMVYMERLNYDPDTIIKLQVKLQNTLIIDFFDSVGIIIETKRFSPSFIFKFWYFTITDNTGFHLNNHSEKQIRIEVDSRQEATIAGIKKANEIFNSKF